MAERAFTLTSGDAANILSKEPGWVQGARDNVHVVFSVSVSVTSLINGLISWRMILMASQTSINRLPSSGRLSESS